MESTLDSAVLLLVAILFVREGLNFLRLLRSPEEPSGGFRSIGIIRPLSFIFFLATDLSVSFIPLAMKSLGAAAPGAPSNILGGLPISAEMLCAGLATLLGGYVIDTHGWRPSFFTGAGVLMSGALLSGLTGSQGLFIVARGIVGLGYGLSWMAMRGYVAACPAQAAKVRGFSHLNAGIYAGNICACALGGRLAEALGFPAVFFISAGVLLLAAAFALFVQDPGAPRKSSAHGSVTHFMKDSSVSSLSVLITIPSAICLAGFLNSFFPLFARSHGHPASEIGTTFMLYGCCIVFLGPCIGTYISRNPARMKVFILIGSSIGAVSMLLFAFSSTFWTALVTIFLLGIADCIGFVSQNAYFLGLKATRRFGDGKALGLFSMTKKIGQMLGPLVFGWVATADAPAGIGLAGLAYCLTIALYLLAGKPASAAGQGVPVRNGPEEKRSADG